MKRRAFITLLGGAAVWPLAARAQQAMPVVGFMRNTPAEGFAHLVAAFRAGLAEAGFAEGRNVALDLRWGDNQVDRVTALAAELIRKPVAVLVGNTVAALAAKPLTATVPIVFVSGSDPVKDGLVTSMNRPGGNVTGVSFVAEELTAKRLELLRLMVPGVATVAALLHPRTSRGERERQDLQAIAQSAGQRLIIVDVSGEQDLEPAFASMVQQGAAAVSIGAGAFFNSHRAKLAELALLHRLPALHNDREFAVAGGLMSYGASLSDAYRQGGVYAGRILKGEKPGDLPVLQPTKFELVLNLKTAKTLGLAVPDRVLALADEVIE